MFECVDVRVCEYAVLCVYMCRSSTSKNDIERIIGISINDDGEFECQIVPVEDGKVFRAELKLEADNK